MDRRIVYVFAAIMLASLMFGCKSKKAVVIKKKARTDYSELIKGVESGELDYRSLEMKLSTRAELDGKKYGLNITYRNDRDQTLWISVRAMLGIEAARVIANRDSVWLVSKMAQMKEKGSWKEMSKLLGYPLDFMALQNIMTRKMFYPGQEGNDMLMSFLKRDDGSQVLIVPDFEDIEQRKDAGFFGFMPQFVIDKSLNILKATKLVPEDNEWMLEVEYDNDSNSNLGIGNNIRLSAIDSQNNMDLDLKIQQVSINEELKFPFQWF